MDFFVLAIIPTELIIWGCIIAAVAVVGGVILMAYRHHLLGMDQGESLPGFTLEELRKLRDRGELSDQEYEIARNRMAMAVKKAEHKKHKSKNKR